MLRLDLAYAQAGMTLAMPVNNPKTKGRYLLHGDYELSDRDIRRLREFGVRQIWVRYPPLAFLREYVSPAVLEQRDRVVKVLEEGFSSMQDRSSVKLRHQEYCQEISTLVQRLLTEGASARYLDSMTDSEPSLVQHSSRVAYLCLLIGLKLDAYLIRQRPKLPAMYAKKVTSLGVGAMLHDLGKTRLNPEILERWNAQPDEADVAWQQHVHLGYELVRGTVDPSAAAVVLHHHQRYDGQGFPKRVQFDGSSMDLAGDRIHIYARIAAVADMFDMIRTQSSLAKTLDQTNYHRTMQPNADNELPEDQVIPTVAALRRMLESDVLCRFDPEVVRAFLAVVPAYAPGTILKLSDGRWATAIDHCPAEPCRPKVQLIKDPTHMKPGEHDGDAASVDDSCVIDLTERVDLYVAEAEGVDVSKMNFDPPKLAEDFHGGPVQSMLVPELIG